MIANYENVRGDGFDTVCSIRNRMPFTWKNPRLIYFKDGERTEFRFENRKLRTEKTNHFLHTFKPHNIYFF